MTEHTKEPWFHDGDAIYDNADCVGDPIAHVLSCAYDNDLNNMDARRIVACVNACARLDTEKLEQQNAEGVPLWMFVQDLSRQKEYLMQQLKEERVVWSAKRTELLRNHDAELARRKDTDSKCDHLLAALEALVEAHDTDCSDTDRRWALVNARLAIAAVKGD